MRVGSAARGPEVVSPSPRNPTLPPPTWKDLENWLGKPGPGDGHSVLPVPSGAEIWPRNKGLSIASPAWKNAFPQPGANLILHLGLLLENTGLLGNTGLGGRK